MIKELERIIEEYKSYAVNHGEATLEGDSTVANQNYDKLKTVLKQIKEFGDDGGLALLSLLEDNNQSIRCWAATDSLRFNESKAKKALKKLSKEDGIIAFDAKMVLKEWRKGTLKLP